MKTCQEYLEIHSAWIDGEAEAGEIAEMQEHFRQCPECRTAGESLSGLSRKVRDDSTDYLRISSDSLAEVVLLQPGRIGFWPSPRQFLFSKVFATLGVGLWSYLVLLNPLLLGFWPVLGMGLFALAQHLAVRNSPESLRPWFENTLRPFGWGLLGLTLLPTSALLASGETGAPPESAGIFAGLCLAVTVAGGALFGILRSVNPEVWNRLRLAPWILCVTTLVLGILNINWLALGVTLAATIWAWTQLREALVDTSLEGEGSPFGYPACALLVDLGGLLFLTSSASGLLEVSVSPDLISVLGLKTQPASASYFPLTVGLWWMLVRTPLATLTELAQGTRQRYYLAGILGGLLAFLLGIGSVPIIFVLLMSAGVLLGLLLALRDHRSATPHRRAILKQRMTVWAAVGLLGTLLWLGSGLVPVPAEPAEATQLRLQAEKAEKPEKPARSENGYTHVTEELRLGPDAEIGTYDWTEAGPSRDRLLGYLQENFQHIDAAVAAPKFSSGGAYLDTNHNSEIDQVLLFRIRCELAKGETDRAVTHLLGLAEWDLRLARNGRPAGWRDTTAVPFANLLDVLQNFRLTAQNYRTLWSALSVHSVSRESIQQCLDTAYVKKVHEISKRSEEKELLHLPRFYYQRQLGKLAKGYLQRRSEIKMTPTSYPAASGLNYQWLTAVSQEEATYRENLTRSEEALAALGVNLYRAEKGYLPQSLEEVEQYLGRPFHDFTAADGKLAYRLRGDTAQIGHLELKIGAR